ncbi:hypothetical protein GCM10027280_12080 [Micromonospora polyrhachis]|uniref:Fe2OG dioxygenase domain-containing protein n=1 Tax=Micromonospora polyrhachis TaxID=1282883 RepID=A0A7W7WQW7_9ACTN|nr:2OG-Fe(II) oxygenase [Micromonospora polyrhachis]MBB4959942.1 hypothetical protein [Micromonospora polyrhachis]
MTIALSHEEELTASSLAQLINGEIELIWHRGYYPTALCEQALPRIATECEAAGYTLTDDFQSLGTSLGEAAENESNAARYLATAAETTALIRHKIFDGQLSPTDLLRLDADELWPYGATVARHQGRTMLPGIIRRWPGGAHANPHIDQRDIPLLDAYRLIRRVGVNVYLQVPEPGNGGEIDFWGLFTDEAEYVSQKRPDYGLDRATLGAPHFSVLPGQGDLLMFDAARVHGVRRVERGVRVTAACFLGVRGPAEPLLLFA